MTIQMNNGAGTTGNIKLPPPSGAVITFANGIGAVPAEDVDIAIGMGWQVQAGESWPGGRLVRMTRPTNAAWPANGTVTLPDGSSLTITASVAKVPQAFVNYLANMGWTQ